MVTIATVSRILEADAVGGIRARVDEEDKTRASEMLEDNPQHSAGGGMFRSPSFRCNRVRCEKLSGPFAFATRFFQASLWFDPRRFCEAYGPE